MVCLTVRSEFFNEFLDYVDTNIVEYIFCDLKEVGKLISFHIRLNYDLEINQIEQIKFLINKKARELDEKRTFSRLDIRKKPLRIILLSNMFSLFVF